MDPVKELDALCDGGLSLQMVDGELIQHGPDPQPLLDALHLERFGVPRPTGNEIGEQDADEALNAGFAGES